MTYEDSCTDAATPDPAGERRRRQVDPAVLGALSASPQPVAVFELCLVDTPRRSGEDESHIEYLAGVPADRLPPIVVHRGTLQVIDGAHRVRAARMRGDREISAVFVDGSLASAFILGVRLNSTHGLPLTRADRVAAVVRILGTHPGWSDRVIAETVGVSAKSVATLRRQRVGAESREAVRTGKDGRRRPVDPMEGRRRAEQVLTERPDASLRQVARAAGVAVETARRVRARMLDAGPGATVRGTGTPKPDGNGPAPVSDVRDGLAILKSDPSVRSSESGRVLLRMLDLESPGSSRWTALASCVPEHCSHLVAELAERRGRAWVQFARQLRGVSGNRAIRPGSS